MKKEYVFAKKYNGIVRIGENEKYHTKNYGSFIVLGKLLYSNKFVVEFEDGYIREANSSAILSCMVKNPYHPSIYGVGYIGIGDAKVSIDRINTKEYCLWFSMIQRCYGPRNSNNKTYANCTVEKDWHNFQIFAKDIIELDGYDNWKSNMSDYQLDKDKLSEDKLNPIYGKASCCFISRSENIALTYNKGEVEYIATRIIDGYKEKFKSQAAFARKYGLHASGVSGCLTGKRKTSKGWTFSTL